MAERCALGASLAMMLALVSAAPCQAENLFDALAGAYHYSPTLDAERSRQRGRDEDVARANSGYRPSVNGSADFQRQSVTTHPPGAGGASSPRGWQVQLVQPVFTGFQTTNAVNGAEASVRAGAENLRLTEQQVLLDAVTAYGDVVRDQAILKLRENNLKFLTAELKATQDRFNVGEVTRTDVAQAEARRALGQSDLDNARANLKSSRAVYEQVIGHPPAGLVEPNPNSKLLPRSLEEAVEIGNRENPQVVGALYTEQAARYGVDQIRGELLPDAQVEATYSDRFDDGGFGGGSSGLGRINETQTTSVVGRINVPIYPGGGEVYARLRQAKHTHVSRLQEIEQARSTSQSQVVQSWSQLQGFRAQSESDRAQIKANTTALNGVKEEERVGQRTLLDVLNAQQELLSSQVSLETTKRNILVASYTVISSIGRLSIAELGVGDQVYDPKVHYDEVRRKWFGIDITHDDGRSEHIEVQPAAPIK